jgi:hypothetical protein
MTLTIDQHNPTTSFLNRLPIEKYALITENAPELGRMLDTWYGFFQPGTPGECALIDMAVMALVQQQRVLACLTETVNQEIRTAVYKYNCEQEDEVQHYRGLLETRPGEAVVGLKRSALGVRFLIGRWERLLRLIEDEGTLYGNDRDEAIHYQGARATTPENLFESEGAYLTWVFCLMAQPKPKDEDFVNIGNEKFMPLGLNDRNIENWLGDGSLCRRLLTELAERELAYLRPREELLRLRYETLARDGAEVRKQVLQGPIGARLQREADNQARHFHRAYNAFLKGRAQSEKTGRLPGGPIPELHEPSALAPEPAPDTDTGPADQAAARRKQDAAALAPGGENGIGAPVPLHDHLRAAATAARSGSADEGNHGCDACRRENEC